MATLEKLDLGTARLSEAARIAGMSRRWIEQGLPWRYRPHSIARQIRDSETAVVVARAAGHVVGFAVMEFHFDAQRAHLVLLAVEPAYRRRGVGLTLFRWLEKVARLGGIEWIGSPRHRFFGELRVHNFGPDDWFEVGVGMSFGLVR